MKKIHIAGGLLKSLLLAGLLTGCQNEDLMTPTDTAANVTGDQHAKVASEIRLVKDGDTNLQYKKSGRYTGMISKVSDLTHYTNYSYTDGGVSGEYWINSKQYLKSNDALVKEIQYHIVDGTCVKSHNITNGEVLNFSYHERTRLENITREGSSEKVDFTYIQVPGTDKYQLFKMYFSNANGDYKKITFYYTGAGSLQKVDKYSVNNEHVGVDKYLPVFGKFSEHLVQQAKITPLPYTNQSQPDFKYYYGLDSDGYAVALEKQYFPLGLGNDTGKQVKYTVQKYSTQWQGL